MENPKQVIVTAALLILMMLGVYFVATLFAGKNNSSYNVPQGCENYGEGKGCW